VKNQTQCQAKYLTCEISDFTPYARAQSNILHIKYTLKSDDWGSGFGVWVSASG